MLLGKYGVSQARARAMTEPELMGWLEALKALNAAVSRHPARAARSDTRTSQIQSLRRKPVNPKR